MAPDRIIRIEGEGLLPPCFEPQFPPNMKEEERVRVIPPCPPWAPQNSDDIIAVMNGVSPQDQRYWFFSNMGEQRLPQHNWLEDPWRLTGRRLYGSGRGLAAVSERTTFRFITRATAIRFPDLWQPHGVLVMSRRLLGVILEHDPDAVEFRSVLFTNTDGIVLRDDFVIADVIRNVAAIDIANSIVDYGGPSGEYSPFLARFVNARIRDDLPSNFHLFRQKSFTGPGGREIIVSAAFRGALEALKPKLKNTRFDPCGGRS